MVRTIVVSPFLLAGMLFCNDGQLAGGAYCWESRSEFPSFVPSGRAVPIIRRKHRTIRLLRATTQSSEQFDNDANGDDKHDGSNDVNDETKIHTNFMTLALQLAETAKRKGEVPVGAIVVQRSYGGAGSVTCNGTDVGGSQIKTYKILSQAYNLVETRHDASAHAELLALRRAAQKVQNWRLTDTILYSTLEPCPMCLAAAQAFRVSSIVYGAPDLRLGAVETHMRLLDDYDHPYHNIHHVVPGVMKEESALLLKSFFRDRRMGNLSKSSPRLRKRVREIWRKIMALLSGLLQRGFRRQG